MPRYHVVWGTSLELTKVMIAALHKANTDNRLTLLHQHSISELITQDASNISAVTGAVIGAIGKNDITGEEVQFQAQDVVLATGGINGSHKEVRTNWPKDRAMPEEMLNGAHPFADGNMHHEAVDKVAGQVVNPGEMWNYAAGFPHPYPHFEGHGLSTIPCKSALWLNHKGERILSLIHI